MLRDFQKLEIMNVGHNLGHIITEFNKLWQTKIYAISEFRFLIVFHTDFCNTCWEIFLNCEIMKIGHSLTLLILDQVGYGQQFT